MSQKPSLQLPQKNEKETVAKKLNPENRKLQELSETKSLELKHLKLENENVKKEKNVLSVALKGSKQEIKELDKAYAKEKKLLELKLSEVEAFRNEKLRDERVEKTRLKKEKKKAKQNRTF